MNMNMNVTTPTPLPPRWRQYAWQLLSLLVLALTLGATGCAASSEYMTEVETPQPLEAPPDKALLVFMRPSSFGGAIGFTVVNDQGEYWGEPLPDSHYAITVNPGKHMVYAWSENVAALEANVEAGRVYFILVEPNVGLLKARVQLTAFNERHEDWAEKDEWLHDTVQYRVDMSGGQAALDPEDVREKVAEGREVFQDYDAEDRAERVVQVNDGMLTTRAVAAAEEKTTAR